MAQTSLEQLTTPAVLAAQAHYYGQQRAVVSSATVDLLGEDERAFIASRDSFYLSTVSESGWPYIQHRGGAPGFLRVLGPSTLAAADFRGNRQMLTAGNASANDRCALFLMDYVRRVRLKLLCRLQVLDARAAPELVTAVTTGHEKDAVERVLRFDVVGFDWNCPKHITPRYSADEVSELIAAMKARITDLEKQLSQFL